MNRIKHFSLFVPLLVAIALAGSILLFVCTSPWGIGVSKDGARYIAGARSILEGHGYRDAVSMDPITNWPPFFPFTLAVIGLFGIDPVEGARILHILLFGLNIFIVGLILKRFTQSTLIALFGAWLFLTSSPIVESHILVRSEPWFIFLVFTGFFFLLQYLSTGAKRLLFFASFFTALACLDRYAGVSVIAAGMIMILFSNQNNLRHPVIHSMIYGILSFLPLGLWIMRNYLTAHDPVNRTIYFHFPAASYFHQALATFSSWLVAIHAPLTLQYFVLIIFLTTAITMMIFVAKREKSKEGVGDVTTHDFFRMMALMITFSFCVIGLELFHHAFLYAHVQASDRHFLPVFVACLIGSFVLLHRFLKLYPHPFFKIFAVVFLLSLNISYLWNSSRTFTTAYHDGDRFTSRKWRTSPTIAKAKSLPTDAFIYSNEPGALYILTNRKTYSLPRKYSRRHYRDKESAKPDEKFLRRLNKVKEKLASRKGYIVFFHPSHRWHKVSEEELQHDLPLVLVDRLSDGVIYQIKAPATQDTTKAKTL